MTYGQLRYRLSKSAPGVDLELIDGWIQDRYTEILDALPWRRMEGETVFQWFASYAVGTVTATQGSMEITGDGTGAWTADMDGLMVRIANGAEYYFFTYVDATNATLDRPYEGVGGSGLGYRVDESVFALPPYVRILRGVRSLQGNPHIQIISHAELDRIAKNRPVYGEPRWAALSFDSFTDPPAQQLELYPIPDCPDSTGNVLSYAVAYVFDPDDIDATQTGSSLLPWVRPSALIAGVQADIAMEKADAVKAQMYEARFGALVKQMLMTNAWQKAPQQIGIAREFRGGPNPYYQRGPWHRGFTG